MNETLQRFARQQLIDGLAKLPDGWQRTFKLMYRGKHSVDDVVNLSIAGIVATVPADKLDWAMQQVERSVAKLEKQSETDR